MSGLEVVGAISAVIGILDASVKAYEILRKDAKLSETYQVVGMRLPIILNTLKNCRDHLDSIQDTPEDSVCDALDKIVEACREKARMLRDIFKNTLPVEGERWDRRYKKAIRKFGKGKKVEELMLGLTQDVQLLVNQKVVMPVDPKQETELKEIIEDMKNAPPSITTDVASTNYFEQSGSGTYTTYTAPIEIGTSSTYHGAIGTLNTGSNNYVQSKDDFSFRGPQGLCLRSAPAIDSSLFVGRDTDMEKMQSILMAQLQKANPLPLVLSGMGGVGKTQLAIAYATRYCGQFSSIFWLNATSNTTLQASFRAIADLIFENPNPAVLEGNQSVTHVNRWLSDRKNSRWLLIFDNYDETEDYKIKSHFPTASQGSIIITTRRLDRVEGIPLDLQPVAQTDGLEILRARSKSSHGSLDIYARQLAKRLDGLPLPLATAGAFLLRAKWTFKRYLEEYELRWNVSPQRPTKLHEYEHTLYTTWDLSHQALLREEGPLGAAAARLLTLLAFFDHQAFWHKVLSAGLTRNSPKWLQDLLANDGDFGIVMGLLTEYCFVNGHDTMQSWSMHSCVHDWTLAILNANIDSGLYWYAFECTSALTGGQKRPCLELAQFTPLVAHACRLVAPRLFHENLMSYIPQSHVTSAKRLTILLQKHDQCGKATQIWDQVLEACGKRLDTNSAAFRLLLHHQAQLYYEQGLISQAEEICVRNLPVFEQSWSVDHDHTLDVVNLLIGIYVAQERLAEAQEMASRALIAKLNKYGYDCTDTLVAFSNLAALHERQGRYDEAENVFLRILPKQDLLLGAGHPDTIATLERLGVVYMRQERWAEYEQILLRLLAIKEKTFAADRRSTLETISLLGQRYCRRDQMERAASTFLKVMNGRSQLLDSDHPSTIQAVCHLGMLYHDLKQYDRAEGFFRQILEWRRLNLRERHPATLSCLAFLGDSLYCQKGKLQEAEQVYAEALEGYTAENGPDHSSTQTATECLGYTYLRLEKLMDAEALFARLTPTPLRIANRAITLKDLQKLPELIELAITWAITNNTVFECLCRTLLRCSEEQLAHAAFTYQIAFHGKVSPAICDGCDCSISSTKGRAICRQCADTDVCAECFVKLNAGELPQLPDCASHSFLELDFAAMKEEAGSVTEAQLVSWLRGLSISHGGKGAESDVQIPTTDAP